MGHLVLTRRRDESIVIGANIVVTIIDIRGDRIRVGVRAPDEIEVDRLEVRDAKDRERRAEGGGK